MSTNFLEEELHRKSVFRPKGERYLDIEYVPQTMPHREEHLRQLARIFKSVIESPSNTSQKVLIHGNTGTGKTAVTKYFGAMIEDSARKRSLRIDYKHINCRSKKTEYLVLLTILRHYDKNIPKRGFSPSELLHMLIDILEAEDRHLVLTLDEVDYLVRTRGPDLIYDLTRLTDDRLNAPQRLSLITIVRDTTFLNVLDSSTLSTFQKNVMKLEKYTASQLEDILNLRVQYAFRDNTVPKDTISLIADIASDMGDARYAIELLWKAGKYADSNNAERVYPEFVRLAKSEIHPEIRKEILDALSDSQRVLLLSIARQLINKKSAYITIGELEEMYQIVSEEYSIKPRAHTQVWTQIQELEHHGIISTKISGQGYRGKTTLIGLPEIPAEQLERILTKYMKSGEYI